MDKVFECWSCVSSGGMRTECDVNMWTALDRSMRTELENALKVSAALLDALEQHESKVFTSDCRSEVSALEESKEKAQKIIAVLEASKNIGYQCLVDVLTKMNQQHLLPCGAEGKAFLFI